MGDVQRSSAFREVHKNTWLKVIIPGNKKKNKYWVVFCVHDDVEPLLEIYTDNKVAATHQPHWFVTLKDVMHITPTIYPQDKEYEFVITLQSDIVRLNASSWCEMIDWVETVRRKLHEMHILAPKENVYSKLPETKNNSNLLSTRDPTSPLPCPPVEPLNFFLPGVETPSEVNATITLISSITTAATTTTAAAATTAATTTAATTTAAATTITTAEASASLPLSSIITTTTHYEQLFTQSTTCHNRMKRAHRSASNCDRHETSNEMENGTRQRSNSLTDRAYCNEENSNNNRSGNSNNTCNTSNTSSSGSYLMLRTQQVLQLRKEIMHAGGVRLKLRRRSLSNALALVDVANAVWIAGWKQKEYPALYNALHIGDQLISVQGVPVNKVTDAYRLLLNNNNAGLYAELLIKRLPFGKVFAIKRDTDGQSLGVVQENNGAVLKEVLPDGLAARHGLPPQAQTIDAMSLTSWVLTEINGRPLNLFFKGNEVTDRLNCIGRDISILVQPYDLIKQFKKQLKSMRKYKQYLLE